MKISQEARHLNAVRSYNEKQLLINDTWYSQSILISQNQITSPWNIQAICELNETHLPELLTHHPEIIIIGHQQGPSPHPISLITALARLRIGVEIMPIGSACRTFNLLLSEQRSVVLGIVFEQRDE